MTPWQRDRTPSPTWPAWRPKQAMRYRETRLRRSRLSPEWTPIALLKLVVHPLLCYVVLSWIGNFSPTWTFSAVLLAALPTATNVFVIAQQYAVWVQRASASVLITTCLSVVTVTGLLYMIRSGVLPADLFP